MGVYIYRSFHAPYIKVGHYAGKNAFSRIAHRGFTSCVCPREIRDCVSMNDMELIAWYPYLTKKIERKVKTQWKASRIYGKSEWFPAGKLGEIQTFLDGLGENKAHLCDPFEAVLTRRRL